MIDADLILHVRDIAHPDSEAQAKDVAAVLSELGIDLSTPGRFIEVWNKIDLLPPAQRPAARPARSGNGEDGRPVVIAVSALTGEGLPELLAAIEQRVAAGQRDVLRVELTGEGSGELHRLYEFGEVLEREDRADGATVASVRVAKDTVARFRKAFPKARSSG